MILYVDLFYNYGVHCNMTCPIIELGVKYTFFKGLQSGGLVQSYVLHSRNANIDLLLSSTRTYAHMLTHIHTRSCALMRTHFYLYIAYEQANIIVLHSRTHVHTHTCIHIRTVTHARQVHQLLLAYHIYLQLYSHISTIFLRARVPTCTRKYTQAQ